MSAEIFACTSSIISSIDLLLKAIGIHKKMRKEEFQQIQGIFESAKIVTSNYLDILQKLIQQISSGSAKLDDIKNDLETKRLELYPLREQIRQVVLLKSTVEDENIQLFCKGILGVMYSGFSISAEPSFNLNLHEYDDQGHTILDLIRMFEKPEKYACFKYGDIECWSREETLSHISSCAENRKRMIAIAWKHACTGYATLQETYSNY